MTLSHSKGQILSRTKIWEKIFLNHGKSKSVNKNDLILFTLILSTIPPGILGTTHLSFTVAIPSLLLGLVIAYLTYSLVNVKWDYQGLYSYAKDFHPIVGYIFLTSWLTSYYLYVIYTAVYIPYYVLGLDSTPAILLTVIISTITVAAILTNPYYLFPIIGILQLALVIPIGWKISPGLPTPIPSLFTNVLSSSLIVVCITLSTFLKGEKSHSYFIPLAYLVAAIPLLYSSFLQYNQIAVYGEAIGNFGLILAEFTMIKNLVNTLSLKKWLITSLAFISIPLILIGNLNYQAFYITLIVPSVALLYLSLFTSFLSTFKYFSSSFFLKSLGGISLILFAYGEYNVISSSQGMLLIEAIAALILAVAIGVIAYQIKNKIRKPFV